MCSSPSAPKAAPEKKPQYLRNPYLDGLTIGGGATQGRNALRVDPGSTAPVLTQPQAPSPASPPINPQIPGLVIPTPRPPRGGGGGGGGGGRNFIR